MTPSDNASASAADLARYIRQVSFRGLGEAGQRRLFDSCVVLVGCGATGSVLANHMVRAGVGRLRVIDRDVPELNNLPRQMLFDEADVAAGTPKALAAARRLRQINSAADLDPLVVDLIPGNVLGLLAGADLVLDASDNFATRYLLNEACIELSIPWVYTGVVASYGMSMPIIPGETACLRCVLGPEPPAGAVPTIYTEGVIGPAVVAIASISAATALRLLAGTEPVQQWLVHIDLWEPTFDVMEVGPASPGCPACGQPRRPEYLHRADAGPAKA
jgi:molybdopterin/thiamine biosynthesis adenylyltransferase